jgi:phosphatidylserine decarboxylase
LAISRYGTDIVVKFGVVVLPAMVCTFLFVRGDALRYTTLTVLGLFTLLVLNFFRDPDRTPPQEANVIVAPADGRIVQIKDVHEKEYLHSDAVLVSIFMSPLNVHVNRFPISGTVGYFKHIPGEYIVAFDDKASDRNERTMIGVENKGCKVLFKQIAGAVARRIVADITLGQPARVGERFGMIKFGSRVDVFLPKFSDIKVRLNDRVRAGETILGTYAA